VLWGRGERPAAEISVGGQIIDPTSAWTYFRVLIPVERPAEE
jgi:hypothetical protein